jgi:hypothetical protein
MVLETKTCMEKQSKMTPTDRIKQEAEAYAESRADHLTNIAEYNTFNDLNGAYIAGATAEHERAKVLVDALREFISYHETGLLPARHVYEKGVNALEQWEGKEVGDETCGICKEKPMADGLTVCNECYEKFDGDRRGFWKGDAYQ